MHPWGFSCHSASLITADVLALVCSAFACLGVKLTRDGHEFYILRNKMGYEKEHPSQWQLRCDSIWDNNDRKRRPGAGGCSNGWCLLRHVGAAALPLCYDASGGGGIIFWGEKARLYFK